MVGSCVCGILKLLRYGQERFVSLCVLLACAQACITLMPFGLFLCFFAFAREHVSWLWLVCWSVSLSAALLRSLCVNLHSVLISFGIVTRRN